MDLHFTPATPSAPEREAVDNLLGSPEEARGGQTAREQQHLLLPALHAVQDRIGWISEGALNYICRRLSVPPSHAYGVATFYAMFSVTEQPPLVLHVCDDVACIANGADEICMALERDASIPWRRSPCLGLCECAPAALLTQAGERPSHRAIAPIRSQHVSAGTLARQSGTANVPVH